MSSSKSSVSSAGGVTSVSLAALIELLAMNAGSVYNLPYFVDGSVKITGTHNFRFKPLFLGNIFSNSLISNKGDLIP